MSEEETPPAEDAPAEVRRASTLAEARVPFRRSSFLFGMSGNSPRRVPL
jgi:hypothetical protein